MTAINIFEFQTYSSAQKDLLFFYCVEMRTFVLCRALFRDWGAGTHAWALHRNLLLCDACLILQLTLTTDRQNETECGSKRRKWASITGNEIVTWVLFVVTVAVIVCVCVNTLVEYVWPSVPQTGEGWTTGQGLHFEPGLWSTVGSLKLGQTLTWIETVNLSPSVKWHIVHSFFFFFEAPSLYFIQSFNLEFENKTRICLELFSDLLTVQL